MLDSLFSATVTLPWFVLALAALLLFVLGAAVARRFGTEWLVALRFVVGEDELEAVARLIWAAGLIPAAWRKVRFQDDEDKFVAWALALGRGLLDKQVAMQRVAHQRNMTRFLQ